MRPAQVAGAEARALLFVLWAYGTLVGCSTWGRPELLVCRSARDDGGCVDRTTELVVGRTYTVVARRGHVPEGATLELARYDGARAIVLGRAPMTRASRGGHATNPLTLPRRGTYRVVLRNAAGTPIARTIVRAPRPVIWNARPASPAPPPAP